MSTGTYHWPFCQAGTRLAGVGECSDRCLRRCEAHCWLGRDGWAQAVSGQLSLRLPWLTSHAICKSACFVGLGHDARG